MGVVEVEARDGIARLRRRGLLLEPDRAAGGIELDDAVTLGIAYPVAEHGRAVLARAGGAEHLRESVPVEDVVPQDETRGCSVQELPRDQQRLGQAVRARL